MNGTNDSNGRGKRGRREQTRPLIISPARSRVELNVTMSAATARELRAYVRWAANVAALEEEEAMALTLDKAIPDLLKRDALWQTQAANGFDEEPPVVTALPTVSASTGKVG